jgi:hypothetical protein
MFGPGSLSVSGNFDPSSLLDTSVGREVLSLPSVTIASGDTLVIPVGAMLADPSLCSCLAPVSPQSWRDAQDGARYVVATFTSAGDLT